MSLCSCTMVDGMRFVQNLRFTVRSALVSLVMLFIGVATPATAMATMPMNDMAHGNVGATNCVSQHPVAPSTASETVIDEFDNEDDTTPSGDQPYFVQFQAAMFDQYGDIPKNALRSHPHGPPDITVLTNNRRL